MTDAARKAHSGIIGYDSFHFVVENLERSRAFYTERLDFKEVARASADLTKRSGQEALVFGAGDVRVCVSTPLGQSSKAARYMKKHPAGVMSLSFRVEDLDRTIEYLEPRGATFLADPVEHQDSRGGTYRSPAQRLSDLGLHGSQRRSDGASADASARR